MPESSAEVMRRYLEEGVAIEESLETELRSFVGATPLDPLGKVFEHCAFEAKRHHEKLSEHLALSGGLSTVKPGFLAHLFAPRTKVVHTNDQGKLTPAQQLVIAFAAENGGIAFYEALAGMAAAASDADTETLARLIQQEKRRLAEEIWQLLGGTSSQMHTSSPDANRAGLEPVES